MPIAAFSDSFFAYSLGKCINLDALYDMYIAFLEFHEKLFFLKTIIIYISICSPKRKFLKIWCFTAFIVCFSRLAKKKFKIWIVFHWDGFQKSGSHEIRQGIRSVTAWIKQGKDSFRIMKVLEVRRVDSRKTTAESGKVVTDS